MMQGTNDHLLDNTSSLFRMVNTMCIRNGNTKIVSQKTKGKWWSGLNRKNATNTDGAGKKTKKKKKKKEEKRRKKKKKEEKKKRRKKKKKFRKPKPKTNN